MRREFHVRFCEGLGVRFPRATRRNVYVRSERAGQRVMRLLRRLYARLRLQVNETKSAVARSFTRPFLGFALWVASGRRVKRKVSRKALEVMRRRVRWLTRRSRGQKSRPGDRASAGVSRGLEGVLPAGGYAGRLFPPGRVDTPQAARDPAQALAARSDNLPGTPRSWDVS